MSRSLLAVAFTLTACGPGVIGAGSDAGTDAGNTGTHFVPLCTELSGTVTSITRGTYCVVGDVIIPTGVTLDIPAGTTFIVKGRHHFGRDPALPDLEPPAIAGTGTIRAIGTAEQPIIFRGETATTRWYGITVSHSHAPVHLEYVTISDTYKDDATIGTRIWRRGGALNSYLNAKGTILRHCTFTNNRSLTVAGAVDIVGHGTWPDQGTVEISDSRFENNGCECAQYYPSSADLCGGGAVRLSQVSGDDQIVVLRNNVFKRNTATGTATIEAFGGALSGSHSGFVIGPGNVFEGNSAATGDGAISCNHEPRMGSVIEDVDPTTVFTGNTPNNGCGK